MNGRLAVGLAGAVAAATVAALATAITAQAAAGCQVSYTVSSQWPGGFGANVTITNLGDAVSGWTLTWSFGAGQTITQLWNGDVNQSGSQVSVRNASWNGGIPTNGTASFGFNGSWNNTSNPVPNPFSLNGTLCNGTVGGGTTTTTTTTTSPVSTTTTATTTTSPATTTTTTSPATTTARTTTTTTSSPGNSRQKVNFNRSWRFRRSDVSSASNPGFDDSSWGTVALPHDFEAPYDVGGTSRGGQSFYVGAGWYRKHFTVPSEWSGKRVEFESEGAFSVTDVWVNGTKIGAHRGGYTGFVFDLTGAIRPGDNEISVRVANTWQPDLAPRTGDHQFSGGLYRDTYLNVTDPVHVTWYGNSVTTPALTNPVWDTSNPAYYRNIDLSQYPSDGDLRANLAARRSNVRVQTEIRNDRSSPVDVRAHHEVRRQGSNTVLATFDSPVRTLGSNSTTTLDALSGSLSDPSAMLQSLDLWAPNNSALYKVTTTLVTGDTTVDSFESTFGFRSAQWKVDGFYLNGVKTLLVGADVHQDHGGWGNAVTNAGFNRDVHYIREAGMNFIRGSHYPHDPSFADATDELGVMFWSEAPFWATNTAGKEPTPSGSANDYQADGYPQNSANQSTFEQSAKDALRDMIRVNRNHPSIINWSMGNEVFFTSGNTSNKAKALASSMRDYAHQLDPTRKAGLGGTQRNSLDQLSVSDISGYNGDGGKTTNTWMPNVVSEYASYTSDRPGTYDPTYGDLRDPSDGTRYRLTTGSAGLALWAGFDHGTIFGPPYARMGMIDYYRLPKDQWYWYRANKSRWSGLTNIADPTAVSREQAVSGTAASMTLQAGKYSSTSVTDDGTADSQLVVTMRNSSGAWVNDTRSVTLTVSNGPGILPGGKSYTFTPGVQGYNGKMAIEFHSFYAGTATVTARSSGLPDATITITTTDTVGASDETEPSDFGNSSRWN